MDDMAQTLQRTSLRRLGRYLMSGDDVVMGRIEDPLTERAARLSVEDRLNLALRHGGDGLEDRVRAVVEEAWEYGETFGFWPACGRGPGRRWPWSGRMSWKSDGSASGGILLHPVEICCRFVSAMKRL